MRLAYCTTEKVNDKTPVNTTNDNGTTHYWYDFEVTDDLIIAEKNCHARLSQTLMQMRCLHLWQDVALMGNT